MRKIAIVMSAIALCFIPLSASAGSLSEWSFHRGVTPSGKSLCSMGTGPRSGSVVKNIVIKQFSGSNHLNITLYKDTWNIPRGTVVVTTIDFMDNKPITLKSYGDGKIVDIEIPKEGTYVFLSLIRDSSFLQIGFPNGSEPTWSVNLSGSAPSLKEFAACSARLTKQNTQPF